VARPLSWVGTAVSPEPSVVAVVLCQPASTCWAKSKPSTSHSLRLLLHPLDIDRDADELRVQPIAYVGSGGFLSQPIECLVPNGAPPRIARSISMSEAQPRRLVTLSDRPLTTVHLLFFSKGTVKVGRNHIWRPKPFCTSSLSEPFRSAMAGGRAGRFGGNEGAGRP
jgi:hypothetical protein